MVLSRVSEPPVIVSRGEVVTGLLCDRPSVELTDVAVPSVLAMAVVVQVEVVQLVVEVVQLVVGVPGSPRMSEVTWIPVTVAVYVPEPVSVTSEMELVPMMVVLPGSLDASEVPWPPAALDAGVLEPVSVVSEVALVVAELCEADGSSDVVAEVVCETSSVVVTLPVASRELSGVVWDTSVVCSELVKATALDTDIWVMVGVLPDVMTTSEVPVTAGVMVAVGSSVASAPVCVDVWVSVMVKSSEPAVSIVVDATDRVSCVSVSRVTAAS